MEYFTTLTQSHLIDLIQSTKSALYVSMPSLHADMVNAISSLENSNDYSNHRVTIHLLIDFDAQTFRQGYGDHEAIKILLKNDRIDIKNLKDNRISFVISDDKGFFLFIESRSLIPADKETINAVRIDPITMVRLKMFFFSLDRAMDFEDAMANAIIEESQRLKEAKNLVGSQTASVRNISKSDIEMVSDDLDKNPPLNPDYRRIVDFYTTKFQYVKMKFEGSNIQHRKIELPKRALPIVDASLKKRLETKLNLFDPATSKNIFNDLNALKEEVDWIRETYLLKVKSRDESLLNKFRKSDFENTVKSIKDKIKVAQTSNLSSIAELILQTKNNLLKELEQFLIENPKALFPDQPNLWQEDPVYRKNEATAKANQIIHGIHWPKAHELAGEFNLITQYSEITWEDLNNDEFVNELVIIGLIDTHDANKIADFKKGIQIK